MAEFEIWNSECKIESLATKKGINLNLHNRFVACNSEESSLSDENQMNF